MTSMEFLVKEAKDLFQNSTLSIIVRCSKSKKRKRLSYRLEIYSPKLMTDKELIEIRSIKSNFRNINRSAPINIVVYRDYNEFIKPRIGTYNKFFNHKNKGDNYEDIGPE